MTDAQMPPEPDELRFLTDPDELYSGITLHVDRLLDLMREARATGLPPALLIRQEGEELYHGCLSAAADRSGLDIAGWVDAHEEDPVAAELLQVLFEISTLTMALTERVLRVSQT